MKKIYFSPANRVIELDTTLDVLLVNSLEPIQLSADDADDNYTGGGDARVQGNYNPWDNEW